MSATMRVSLRLALCLFAGVLVSVMLLPLLMFFGRFEGIAWLKASGIPLAHVLLVCAPEGLWDALTGIQGAAGNPNVRSFLELCAGFLQLGALLGVPLYWFGRERAR
ncbi:MAG: hypothetical protein GAK43_02210 [Stenotrophomonas maltophilia]|nr:MAG: hypothetical protein GAK43_02210 [Stenotrophomonas maltophilia]